MITLARVSKNFGAVAALNNVDLKLKAHQTHALIGGSGSGKSTLLRLLMGLIKPDQGQIDIDFPLEKTETRSMAEKIGYVVPTGGLYPHLNVTQNITLVGTALNWGPHEIDQRLQALCRLTSFPDLLLKAWPRELSSGQRQRVSLMRALFMDPPILLLDEPLGALDPILRSEIQSELKSIFQQLRKTVVFVTHDLPEAFFVGDTVTLLRHGKIEQTGERMDYFSKPVTSYTQKYLDSQRLRLE